MKKIITIILALTLLLSMIACQSKPAPTPVSTKAAVQEAAKPAVSPTATPAPAATKPAAPAKVYNWKFFTGVPAAGPMAAAFKDYAKDIKDLTSGQVDIKIFFVGELPYTQTEEVSAVRDLKVEMAELWPGHVAGMVDWLGVDSLPFLFASSDEALRITKSVLTVEYDKALQAQYNTKIVAASVWPMHHLASTRPVKKLEDLKGLRTRVVVVPAQKVLEKWGLVPYTTAYAETYTALQRGILDGGITGMPYIASAGWFEVCKNLTKMSLLTPINYIIINKTLFEGMPKDIQNVILDVSKKHEKIWQDQVVAEQDVAAWKKAEEMKVSIFDLPEADQKALKDVADVVAWQDWANAAGRSETGKAILKAVLAAKK